MIYKNYEIKKIDINKNKIILFYGQNQGAKEEEIAQLISRNSEKKLHIYDEKQILDNIENIYNEIFSKSLFDDQKIIIIHRVTDKIVNIIENLIDRNIEAISIILNSNILDKKSKLRNLFEKNKSLICVPFYPDNIDILSKLTHNFLRQKNITLSQENINIIANRSNGDRGILKKELEKIQFFVQNKKKISTEDILKLTNLIENYSFSELIDNCLAKNQKRTINILNENNFTTEDCISISKIFLSKSKRLIKLSKDYNLNKDLNKTILNAKPPIFWKDKELVKKQITKWSIKQINRLIVDIDKIELLIKKNTTNPVNLISDFILEKSSIKTNN